jgi:hypothetical protein
MKRIYVTDIASPDTSTIGGALAALKDPPATASAAAAQDGLEGLPIVSGADAQKSKPKLVGREAMIHKINHPDEVQASAMDTGEGPVLVGANGRKLVGRGAMVERINSGK